MSRVRFLRNSFLYQLVTMFAKYTGKVAKHQFESVRNRLLGANWKFTDVLSAQVGKQTHVTVDSLLDQKSVFMDRKGGWKGPELGQALNPGFTLAYFNPVSSLGELGSDGFDNYHAPLVNNKEPFLRRMWLSGRFEFSKELKYGEVVHFEETVQSVKHFVRLDTIVCEYKREFANANGVAVTETRRLGYIGHKFTDIKVGKPYDGDIDSSTVVQPNIISSFRTSALCFNAHRIHYDAVYAQSEGYPQVVVEGPLLILLALQHWTQAHQTTKVDYFDYKITSPVFVDDTIRVCYTKISNNEWNLWIDKGPNTSMCLSGTLKAN